MALFDSRVFANVSIGVVKLTNSWKLAEANGGVSGADYRKVVTQGLIELGMDTNVIKFTEERASIRSSQRKDVVCHTTVFRFAVKKDFRYKNMYTRNKYEVLHIDPKGEMIFGEMFTHIDDFGNEYQPISKRFEQTDS